MMEETFRKEGIKMGDSRTLASVERTVHPASTKWKDFTALIKIGIVNSNLITSFTGLWLAFVFTDGHFLQSLDTVFYALAGSS